MPLRGVSGICQTSSASLFIAVDTRPAGRWMTQAPWSPAMADDIDAPVLTERRDSVLLITLNRPEQRNAVNGALSDGVAAALDELDDDDGLRSAVLTGAGNGFCAGMDLKAFVAGETPVASSDRGFAGIVQRAAAQADHRGDRGLRGGRRLRDRAGVRPDRRRARREARHPRGQALAGRRRRRAAAPAAAHPVPRRDGAGAHRRPDQRRARARARARQPPGRAGRGGRRRARARRGDRAPTARSRSRPPSAILARQRDWTEEEFWAAPGRDRRPGVRLRGRARGRDRLRREARPPVWRGR